jgi:hypothetical protein
VAAVDGLPIPPLVLGVAVVIGVALVWGRRFY